MYVIYYVHCTCESMFMHGGYIGVCVPVSMSLHWYVCLLFVSDSYVTGNTSHLQPMAPFCTW